MVSAHFNPMGTTALVTGASSGLGIGYAHALAERGADLVLVARRQDRLEALAVDLAEKYGATSTVIPLDLSTPEAVSQLVDDLRARAITIGSLINCAGFGSYGNFVDSDGAREVQQVAVNVVALTALTHAFLPDLLKTATSHPRGAALVNVASTAAFQPVPRMAVYAATKAYVVSFTQAIWYETRHTGLKVTTVCPGPVDTEFFAVAQKHEATFKKMLSVDDVMATTFSALDRATTPVHSISGAQNAVLARLATLAPRRAVVSVTGRMSTPGRTG